MKADSRISPLLGGGTGGLREAHHGIDAQHGLAIHQLLDPRLGHVWGFRKRDCAFAELLARAFEGARHGISTVAVRERIVTPDQLMTLGPDEQYVVTAGKAARAIPSTSATPVTGTEATAATSPTSDVNRTVPAKVLQVS